MLETHPVTVTRGPLSWLRSVAIVRPLRPPGWGGRDTSATMWGLLVSGDADLTVDTTPWQKQWPLQNRQNNQIYKNLTFLFNPFYSTWSYTEDIFISFSFKLTSRVWCVRQACRCPHLQWTFHSSCKWSIQGGTSALQQPVYTGRQCSKAQCRGHGNNNFYKVMFGGVRF